MKVKGRPKKNLPRLVADRSFLGRRHAQLLEGPFVGDETLGEIQRRYVGAEDAKTRRRVALEFERAVRAMPGPTLLDQIQGMSFDEFTRKMLGFKLADFQREFVTELGRLHPDGQRVYRLAVLGIGRGGGKTWLSAAVALYEVLRRTDAPSVLLAASVRDQADLAFQYISRWVRGSDELRAAVRLTKSELTVAETSGRLRVISSLGDAAFGETPSVVVADELHVWRSDSHRTLWEALVSGLGKRPDAFLVGITTAPEGSDSLLAELLGREFAKPILERRGDYLRIVRDEDAATLTWWIGAADEACDADDRSLWRRCTPQPWKGERELRFERGALSTPAFRRLVLNQPTPGEDEDQLVTSRMWDELEDPTLSSIPARTPLTIGIESSFGRKTAALATATRLEDDRIAVWCRTWSADGSTPASVQLGGGQVDHKLLQDVLNDLVNSFDVERVVFDPAFVHIDAERLREIGIDVVELANGSEAQREANRFLYRLIDEGRLAHVADAALAEHMTNVRAELDAHGRMAIYRRRQERKADGWFALAAAVSQLEGDAGALWYDPVEAAPGVWDSVLRGPWKDRGVDPADAHATTNVTPGRPLSNWPGSAPLQDMSRPPHNPSAEKISKYGDG